MSETAYITCPICHGMRYLFIRWPIGTFACYQCGGTGRVVRPTIPLDNSKPTKDDTSR